MFKGLINSRQGDVSSWRITFVFLSRRVQNCMNLFITNSQHVVARENDTHLPLHLHTAGSSHHNTPLEPQNANLGLLTHPPSTLALFNLFNLPLRLSSQHNHRRQIHSHPPRRRVRKALLPQMRSLRTEHCVLAGQESV